MNLKLMFAALSMGLLASTAAPAQDAGSVVVKTIVKTLKNDAGQIIAFPRGPLELTVSSYDIPVGARLPVHADDIRDAYAQEAQKYLDELRRGCLGCLADYQFMDTRTPVEEALHAKFGQP